MKSTIKKFAVVAGSAAVLALGMGSAARADDAAPAFAYTLTVSATSDYIFRGISFTDEKPAFQPYLELTYGIGYVGFWASNLNSGALGPFEVDVYAGIRPVTGPVNWDIGILYYNYRTRNGSGVSPGDVSYVEFKVGATTSPIKDLTLGVTGYATPDQSFAVPTTETVEGSISYALPQMGMFAPTLSGLVGYSHSSTSSDFPNGAFFLSDGSGLHTTSYTYWNAGVKLAVDKFFMDFRYWDTNLSGDLSDSRFVFSAGVNLP